MIPQYFKILIVVQNFIFLFFSFYFEMGDIKVIEF
jgi:hypothetical protein